MIDGPKNIKRHPISNNAKLAQVMFTVAYSIISVWKDLIAGVDGILLY